MSTHPPTDPSSPGAPMTGAPRMASGHGGKVIDLLRLARAQRALLWCVLGQIGLQVLLFSMSAWPQNYAMFGGLVFLVLALGVAITSIILVTRVALAYGIHPAMAVIGGLVSALGCIGLILLLVLNNRITSTLKAAGCKVGLMGVSPQEMNKLRNGVCGQCGYPLSGLASEQCPECGWRKSA